MKNKFVLGIGVIIICCIGYIVFFRDTHTLKDMQKELFPNVANNTQTHQPVVFEKQDVSSSSSAELANSISIGIINGLNNLNRRNSTFDENLTIAIARGIKKGLDGCYIKSNGLDGAFHQVEIHCPNTNIF